jgi:hypothetical protein
MSTPAIDRCVQRRSTPMSSWLQDALAVPLGADELLQPKSG